MTGGAKKLHQAVLALLKHGQIEQAAEETGISTSTLQRWMKRPEFQASYQAARREVFQVGLAKLHHLVGDAVETLRLNLACPRPAIQVRAAIGILEHARLGAELLDLSNRLDQLEQALKDKADT